MCGNCHHTTAASFSSALAITNPELIWVHQQEQKRRAGLYHNYHKQSQSQPSNVMSSSASTYSESTTYSYDKEKSQGDTKQKRSMKQRIKETFKEMGSPPTSKYDRDHGLATKDHATEHGPMSSSPLSRT
ncbi:uncharacterized protein F4822DRAFT_325645 [Hypoxylon trugodes]|uniref:uncharacterized protein n=1 Tax=Hypoxylon trugodes TaxID=326681 RepID=UPI00218F2773|nr:uncharacterized protein F4822DRAFT_325645 [Hypoxylon trugodes]KAI1386755.1 hypothetical protein F4822DRAFT_325645 [Hypoxylon trugodes]